MIVFLLIEKGSDEDLTFIQLACSFELVKKVRFVTWEIHLEWGVDDANPKVKFNRIDLDSISK